MVDSMKLRIIVSFMLDSGSSILKPDLKPNKTTTQLSYIQAHRVFLRLFWCTCMAINISVQCVCVCFLMYKIIATWKYVP